jgi:succinylarginine dihydrolase
MSQGLLQMRRLLRVGFHKDWLQQSSTLAICVVSRLGKAFMLST